MKRIAVFGTVASACIAVMLVACGGNTEVTDAMKSEAVQQISAIKMPDYKSWAMNKTESGIRYIELVAGEGPTAERGDDVDVHYNLWLKNGYLVDSNQTGQRRLPFEFEVGAGKVIAGWDEIVRLMNKGSLFLVVIPPKLGYGRNKVGPIPKNATLVFSIEMDRIR